MQLSSLALNRLKTVIIELKHSSGDEDRQRIQALLDQYFPEQSLH